MQRKALDPGIRLRYFFYLGTVLLIQRDVGSIPLLNLPVQKMKDITLLLKMFSQLYLNVDDVPQVT